MPSAVPKSFINSLPSKLVARLSINLSSLYPISNGKQESETDRGGFSGNDFHCFLFMRWDLSSAVPTVSTFHPLPHL